MTTSDRSTLIASARAEWAERQTRPMAQGREWLLISALLDEIDRLQPSPENCITTPVAPVGDRGA